MTILQPTETATYRPAEINLADAVWVEADSDFWVGTTRGDFLGTVECKNGLYSARGSRGQDEGEHSELATAQSHLMARY